MPPDSKQRDIIRIEHMLASIEEALLFSKKSNRKDLDQNRMLTLSLIKEIEIIGEAASKLSNDFKKKNSEIPWETIISTRHRLIHGYFDINLDIVWETIVTDLPTLKRSLQKLV